MISRGTQFDLSSKKFREFLYSVQNLHDSEIKVFRYHSKTNILQIEIQELVWWENEDDEGDPTEWLIFEFSVETADDSSGKGADLINGALIEFELTDKKLRIVTMRAYREYTIDPTRSKAILLRRT